MDMFGRLNKNDMSPRDEESTETSYNNIQNTPESYTECEKHLNYIMSKLKTIGYYKNKIEEFYLNGIEQIKKQKISGAPDEKIIRWLDIFLYPTAINQMDSDIEKLRRDFANIDGDNSLTQQEKEMEIEEVKRMFDYKHGLSVDFEIEIKRILEKLKNAGYREIDIKEFKEEINGIINKGRENILSDYTILSDMKNFCTTKCCGIKQEEILEII